MAETCSTPAEGVDATMRLDEITLITGHPMLDALLRMMGGVLAVLNTDREIIALNDGLLCVLGAHDPGEVLGLRLGQALQCVYAEEEPDGCGTTEACQSCGAALAMVTSLAEERPATATCCVNVLRDRQPDTRYLHVSATPFTLDTHRFILLFLQDVTAQHETAALERVFFHDFNNLAAGLVGKSEILAFRANEATVARLAVEIRDLSMRLAKEVDIQRSLRQARATAYEVRARSTDLESVWTELQMTFRDHPLAVGKSLDFRTMSEPVTFTTDVTLLLRILGNMIANALEATPAAGEVSVWCDAGTRSVTFSVWNQQGIPDEVAARIFQRNFTTTQSLGRGLGTYAMKLFGEQCLGGTVDFTTSLRDGTTFRLALPLNPV